jgi:hypothetical protein
MMQEVTMAKVSGLKEKLHLPLYDAFFVPETINKKIGTFDKAMTDKRVIRFFTDVQNKSRLETNLQAAGVLPSLNSFEAYALRVVVPSVKGKFLSAFIYNSVTSLLVGEKVIVEMPTFWFTTGVGISPENGGVTNHGELDPLATFRFAEPVVIEPQQNFRVEMSFPHDVPQVVKEAVGPFRVWVVLDGYLTRDVQ